MPILSGLTVVALEQAVAAPFATRQLADLGARVIKIERPGTGDFARHYDGAVRGMSSYFVWLNRSKESLTLDVKHPRAAEILARLVERADVFVQNLAPGAAERLGLGGARLAARHPRLVVCNVSGYGADGPYRDRKAYDLLVQCETGVVSATGTPESPAKVGISIADIAGGMYAFSGILGALYARERTGRGAVLDVSLFDALAEWMGQPALYTAYTGAPPPRTGASHATIAPYGPFATAGGAQVFLAIQNEREWVRLCGDVLRRPELAADARFATNPSRVANREALRRIIEEVFAELPAAEVVERLDTAQIATARLNSVDEFLNHPQLVERDRWREVGSPAGAIRMVRPPVITADAEPVMGAIPALGAQTDAVLGWLGYERGEIGELRRVGAV